MVLQRSVERSVTVAFLSLAFGQLFHAYNMRAAGAPLVRNEITRNPYVWGALALCTGLLLIAVYVPVISNVLDTTHPGVAGWALVLGAAMLPVVADIVARTFYTPAPR